MHGTVKIGNQDVEMVANAASPYLFKQLFHDDFLIKVQEKEPEPDLFVRMGFIMAMQAKKKTPDLLKLKFEDFLAWLEEFDALGPILATSEIANIYYQQEETTSVPKSEAG